MRYTLAAAVAALTFACTAALGDEGGSEPGWVAPLADEPLVAVDDSTITLSPLEGRMVLEFAPRGGGMQKTDFVFLSDRIGTVADEDGGGKAGKVSGFFRVTDSGLEIQYDDGRTASLFANVDDGLTMTRRGSGGETVCVSWYPKDHVFSDAERRAAVAAYAQSLGVSEPAPLPKKKPHGVRAQPPQKSVCSPALHGPQRSVEVRASAVHSVESTAPAPTMASTPAPIPAPVAVAAPVVTTAAVPATAVLVVPAGKGASECLSVEVQGAYIGFHNRCANEVQAAYCLQKASDPALTCGTGTKIGAIAAYGFIGAFTDSAATEHDIRWVACSGAASDVTPELDRADPPVGRCLKKAP